MKQAAKDTRPTIEMSRSFVQGIEAALSENPVVRAMAAGIYEGRQLQGRYRLHIVGARLVPDVEAPAASPNGTVDAR